MVLLTSKSLSLGRSFNGGEWVTRLIQERNMYLFKTRHSRVHFQRLLKSFLFGETAAH